MARMMKSPVFPIGVVAELLDIHPETLRIWERNGIVRPSRRSGRRYYTETDLKKLQFIRKLIAENLNLPAIKHYLRLYPCWQLENCPVCMHISPFPSCVKRCWKEENSYCEVTVGEDTCSTCKLYKKPREAKCVKPSLKQSPLLE